MVQFSHFYEKLVKDEPPCLRLFSQKKGEYYTVYGANAEFIADEYFKSRGVIKELGPLGNKYPGCALRPAKMASVVKDSIMLRKQTVEIWEEHRDGSWSVEKKATPGNTQDFEEIFEGMSQTACILSFKLKRTGVVNNIGVALVDSTLRSMQVCEFDDDDSFSNFEAVLMQKDPQECVMAESGPGGPDAQTKKLLSLLEYCGIPITLKPASWFKTTDIVQDLKRLVESPDVHMEQVTEKEVAASSLACLIKYLELLRDEAAHGQFKVKTFSLAEYMRLDAAVVEALMLFPSNGNNNCLQGLLDKCKTHQGSRLLAQWIKTPLLDLHAINRRLDFVELFVDDNFTRQACTDIHLRGLPDLDKIANKFQVPNSDDLKPVVGCYQFVDKLPALLTTLSEHTGKHADVLKREFIAELQSVFEKLGKFQEMVETSIDFDGLNRHEYNINPSFNEKLTELHAEKVQVYAAMERLAEDTAHALGLQPKQCKLNHAGNWGYHFRISRKDETKLRNNNKYTSLEVRKDGNRFTSLEMKQLSRRHMTLTSQYNAEQSTIAQKCVEIAKSYTPVLQQANLLVAELDTLIALSHVSANAPLPYCRPVMTPMGSPLIALKGCRHPLLEVSDGVDFIANDVIIDKSNASAMQIITGPNMGGKSTYIRQAGMAVLMAQIGCFVPCTSAEIAVVDCIQVRVGAGDQQLKGVSTFMKEMLEASSILRSATANSLIIIDELGRGTSTYDGFGLAWAISEFIVTKIGGFCLFATHFQELTALANTNPRVCNKHVTAMTSADSITMLYAIQDGPCDRSFGIHVSELAQFPPQVVAMAKRKAEELEDFGGKMQSFDTPLSAEDAALAAMGTPPAKKQKKVGRAEVVAFLTKFKELPLDSMSDDQMQIALQELTTPIK